MIKLGILDFDTSHVVEFTKRINHKGVGEDQWVEGARVVLGWPGTSRMSPQLIKKYTPLVEELGVTLVARPETMIGKVDGMLIESLEGEPHYERARPFLEAGIPCYIDKPFACRLTDARKIVDLAARKKVPVFSSSSLRYAPELVQYLADPKHGKVNGALAYGPAPLNEADPSRNPGLFHYGIHAVEMLYTLMGPGCRKVTCTHEKGVDLVSGQWQDGRVGSVRGIRAGAAAYGFLAFAERGVQNFAVSTQYIYRELLKKVVAMFQTGKPPIDPGVSVELVGFIEAALQSAWNHGIPMKVEGLGS
jgi:hypothetical protein